VISGSQLIRLENKNDRAELFRVYSLQHAIKKVTDPAFWKRD